MVPTHLMPRSPSCVLDLLPDGIPPSRGLLPSVGEQVEVEEGIVPAFFHLLLLLPQCSTRMSAGGDAEPAGWRVGPAPTATQGRWGLEASQRAVASVTENPRAQHRAARDQVFSPSSLHLVIASSSFQLSAAFSGKPSQTPPGCFRFLLPWALSLNTGNALSNSHLIVLESGTFLSSHPVGVYVHKHVYIHACAQARTHICNAKGRNESLIISGPSASNTGPTAKCGLSRRIFADDKSSIS